ncbi:MAG: VIT1/CCC1 transporter family protein [Gammaproteobacteria bacterium]
MYTAHTDIAHQQQHRMGRIGWLRAAVLGANDGIISIASLVLGIAAAHGTHSSILVAGVAGLVAGALSMAAGEFVSVSSQADVEQADLALEKKHLAADREYELEELAGIYVGRGLKPVLATEVAKQLMAHDALGAHARDELGISATVKARPLQAALTSAGSFAAGAVLPLLAAIIAPGVWFTLCVTGGSLLCLAVLGGLAAYVGGAPIMQGAIRILFWGALAMGVTAGVGALFGAVL